MTLAVVALATQVVMEEKGEVLVGSKGLVTVSWSFDFEGVNQLAPTIGEFVRNLDKTWGNSMNPK